MNGFQASIFILLRSTRGVIKVPFILTLYLTYPPLGSETHINRPPHRPVAVMPQTDLIPSGAFCISSDGEGKRTGGIESHAQEIRDEVRKEAKAGG
jgi:hypothetical protein